MNEERKKNFVYRKETAVNFVFMLSENDSHIYVASETFFFSFNAHVYYFSFLKDICFQLNVSIYIKLRTPPIGGISGLLVFTRKAGQMLSIFIEIVFVGNSKREKYLQE